jgi:lysozyme
MKRRKKNIKKKSVTGILSLFFLSILIITAYFYYSSDKELRKASIRVKTNAFYAMVPKGFSSIGIDLSHHQGNIDWNRLFETARFDTIINFGYCKASEGKDHVDSKYYEYRQELNKRNIPNGAYHFFSIQSDPLEQADHFLKIWRQKETDLPPVLDVEVEAGNDQNLIASMKIWLDRVEQQSGMRPVIYTSLHFYETKFKNHFLDHKFWIAAYSRKPGCIEDGRIIHWQYSEDGVLPGIEEKVDLNVSKISFL